MVTRLAILLLVFSGCRLVLRQSNSYFHPGFRCMAEKGRGDISVEKFQEYVKDFWIPIRLKYNEDNKQNPRSKNVIAGNSLVQLFTPDLLKREFPDREIVNRGIGGDMTDLLLERLDDNVLSLRPATVILEIGGNDMIAGKCLSYVESNVKKIIAKIHRSNPETKIIFVTVPPTRRVELNEIVPVYNLFLYSLTRDERISVLDIWTELRQQDRAAIQEQYARPGDTIHFNEKGYKILGRLLRPYL